MSAMLVVMLTMAAPVPAGSTSGTMMLGVDETLHRILPTGEVHSKLRMENNGVILDRNLRFVVSDSVEDKVKRRSSPRIVIHPLNGDAPPVIVAEYEPTRLVLNADSDAVTFTGKEVKSVNDLMSVWRYDIAAMKVVKLPLPSGRFLDAVAANESQYLLSGYVEKDKVTAWRSMVYTADGKNEIDAFAPHAVINHAMFSPSGTHILATASVYKETVETAKQKFAVWGLIGDEMAIVDVTTKKRTVIDDTAIGLFTMGLAWSPDGTKIAYVRQLKARLPDRKSPPIYAVLVADLDGTNAKEIYRTEGWKLWAFHWW